VSISIYQPTHNINGVIINGLDFLIWISCQIHQRLHSMHVVLKEGRFGLFDEPILRSLPCGLQMFDREQITNMKFKQTVFNILAEAWQYQFHGRNWFSILFEVIVQDVDKSNQTIAYININCLRRLLISFSLMKFKNCKSKTTWQAESWAYWNVSCLARCSDFLSSRACLSPFSTSVEWTPSNTFA